MSLPHVGIPTPNVIESGVELQAATMLSRAEASGMELGSFERP